MTVLHTPLRLGSATVRNRLCEVIATDSEDYAGFVMDAVCHEPLLVNPHGQGCFAPRPDCRPATKYERRGRRLGHAVFDIVAVRAS